MYYSKIYPSTRISSNHAKNFNRKLQFVTHCTLKRIYILFGCVLQRPVNVCKCYDFLSLVIIVKKKKKINNFQREKIITIVKTSGFTLYNIFIRGHYNAVY